MRILFMLDLVDNFVLLGFLLASYVLASLIPDIDSTRSKIRDLFAVIVAAVLTFTIGINPEFNSLIGLFVSFIFIYLVARYFPTKHRGLTHTLKFSGIFSFAVVLVLWIMFGFGYAEFFIYFLMIGFGYSSHLFLDRIT